MFAFLYLIWLVLNGRITLEICVIGIPVCTAVFLFATKFLGYSIAKEMKLYRSIPFIMQYAGLLLFEILKANLQVVRLVLFAPATIRPVRVRFKAPLQRNFARILLANSITLTPGTITAECQDGEYLVHCLSEEFAEGITESSFVKLLEKWEAKID